MEDKMGGQRAREKKQSRKGDGGKKANREKDAAIKTPKEVSRNIGKKDETNAHNMTLTLLFEAFLSQFIILQPPGN